ncbi:magnesium-translocating P-type ATPase [Brochothrix campestris]|uniref:Magnesium-transporting ATPase, P-type 1 n=1 Tax=Brochothrix campestris FSL F6-1037 TaxID=1265861 RepID=W7CZH8_9LIST|nr:magnesium-translocating P-type ATPase [Brochothrix campestris FSL F6-1037]
MTKKTITPSQNKYDFATRASEEELFSYFNSAHTGLTTEAVTQSLTEYGENRLEAVNQTPYWRIVMKAFLNPFTIVLIALAFISFITDYTLATAADKDMTAVIIIMTMVILSGSVSLFQTVKTNKSLEQLQNMIEVTAAVRRNGHKAVEQPIESLVVGDIIELSAGDMLPADLRIIEAKDLFVSQASMTGESVPVEKNGARAMPTKSKLEAENLVFMGSNVVSGTAVGIIIAVGQATQFGQIATDISAVKLKTSFEKGVGSVSWLLIRFMLLMAPTVFIINGLTKGDWLEALMFGLSVAVGLTPEMLPMIVTANLVKGTAAMAKQGTIIKNINAIQNFGAMDVLCTDKTGTITQDKVTLQYHLNVNGKEDDRILRHGFYNSFYQTGLKNLMDVAIIAEAEKQLAVNTDNYQKIDEIPFDFNRRRMSVVIKNQKGETEVITKGAVEEMLAISTTVEFDGHILPLDEDMRAKLLRAVTQLNEQGLRVIAIAQKKTNPQDHAFCIADEAEMTLMGYLAFLDPPKETAQAAISSLQSFGVAVKVLTGDNAEVTRTVCRQVGLTTENFFHGHDLDELSDIELENIVLDYQVFVKLSPSQKTRIVQALQANGKVVGFMGDGINDAAAMRTADIGISVDTAVDIAKESADVILLEKDLNVLEKGMLEGRHLFGNIVKYIKMTASSNFGNMFSVLVASIFLPFLPMLPIQILCLNLIYDTTCISLPWDKVDRSYLAKPRKWEAKSIGNFMRWIGPTSSIFDIITFVLLFFIICPQVVGGQFSTLTGSEQVVFIALFHAGWFVESLWSQTLVIHALRTEKIPFLQSNAARIVTCVTAIGILMGTVLPYTAVGTTLGMSALPLSYFAWLAAIILAYLALVSVMKGVYIRRFGELL